MLQLLRKNSFKIPLKNSKMLQKLLNIRAKLFLGLLIPVIMLAVYGINSYRMSENAIIRNYEHSSKATLDAVSDYLGFGLTIIEEKSQELISDPNIRVYYGKKSSTADPLGAINQQSTIKADITLTKNTNSFISGIHVFGENGKGISTAVPVNDALYGKFIESAEGKLINDNKLQNVWVGSHTGLDELFTEGETAYTSNDYAMSIIRRMNPNKGYVVIDIAKQQILDMFAKYDLGEGSIIGLVNRDGREVINGTDKQQLFTELSFYKEALQSEEPFYYGNYQNEEYLFLNNQFENSGVTICALIPKATILKQVEEIKVLNIVYVSVACLLAILTVIFIAGGVSRSIRSLLKSMSQASKGDLTIQFNTKSKDEFMVLTNGITDMMGNMRNLIGEVQEVGSKVSSSADGMSTTSEELLTATKGISQLIDDIEKGIVQQANDTEQCLLQMADLAEQIDHVYNNTNEIEKIAEDTKNVAKEGIIIVNELNQTSKATADITQNVILKIMDFEQQSQGIAGFVSIINEIANQTNLLSLNASIEAARAGDAGRGFAVVANEIRKLADQSIQSANQIHRIVQDIFDKTKDTIDTAKQAESIVEKQTAALNKTVQVFDYINDHVKDLASNLINIANGVKRIEEAKDDTMEAIQDISAVSEETAASSEEVSATAISQIEAVEQMRNAALDLASNAKMLEDAIKIFKI